MKASIFLVAPLLLILLHSFCVANASIEKACKKAWDEQESYDFCVKILKSNPKSETADKKGLIDIASKATIKQLRVTLYIYEAHKKEGYYKEALGICTHAIELAKYKMEQVVHGYEAGGFNLATIYVSAAMDNVVSCIDAFTSHGLTPLLEKENEKVVRMIHQVSKFIHL